MQYDPSPGLTAPLPRERAGVRVESGIQASVKTQREREDKRCLKRHMQQFRGPYGFIRKWVFSLDHKILDSVLFLHCFLPSGNDSIRHFSASVAWPTETCHCCQDLPVDSGRPMTPEFYLSMVTMHAHHVFMVLTTAPQGGFGIMFFRSRLEP